MVFIEFEKQRVAMPVLASIELCVLSRNFGQSLLSSGYFVAEKNNRKEVIFFLRSTGGFLIATVNPYRSHENCGVLATVRLNSPRSQSMFTHAQNKVCRSIGTNKSTAQTTPRAHIETNDDDGKPR